MSILINENTKVLAQGLTGAQGMRTQSFACAMAPPLFVVSHRVKGGKLCMDCLFMAVWLKR